MDTHRNARLTPHCRGLLVDPCATASLTVNQLICIGWLALVAGLAASIADRRRPAGH
jgi:hypothetical protein